jgi:hypothetical protein
VNPRIKPFPEHTPEQIRKARQAWVLLALLACGLVLVPALVPVPALSDYVTPDGGYTICFKPSSPEAEVLPCDQLPPEEVARQRAKTDAGYAAAKRRYDEQEALPVPITKADLTLNCDTFGFGYQNWTVQVWFGAALLTWGTGEHRERWRLDRVSPAEITFKRVLQDWPPYGSRTQPTFFDADGHIDRVTGDYSRWIDGAHTEKGQCKPAEAKF